MTLLLALQDLHVMYESENIKYSLKLSSVMHFFVIKITYDVLSK